MSLLEILHTLYLSICQINIFNISHKVKKNVINSKEGMTEKERKQRRKKGGISFNEEGKAYLIT